MSFYRLVGAPLNFLANQSLALLAVYYLVFDPLRFSISGHLQELEVQSKHMPALKEAFDIARSNARKVGEELPHIKAPKKDDFDKVFRLPVKSNRYATDNSVIIPGSIQS